MKNQSIPWNADDLIRLYNYTSSGHWFDRDTMRFFRTRITSQYRRIDDSTALFITTELGPSITSKRLATVRKAEIQAYTRDDGRECIRVTINTVGEFNGLTMYQAKKLMMEYVKVKE